MKSQLGLSSGNSDFSADVSMFKAGSTMRGNKVAIYQNKYCWSDSTRLTIQRRWTLADTFFIGQKRVRNWSIVKIWQKTYRYCSDYLWRGWCWPSIVAVKWLWTMYEGNIAWYTLIDVSCWLNDILHGYSGQISSAKVCHSSQVYKVHTYTCGSICDIMRVGLYLWLSLSLSLLLSFSSVRLWPFLQNCGSWRK